MSEFNPADNTVADVKDHVGKNPAAVSDILAAEKARGDDARSTLVSWLEDLASKTPQSAGPKAVDVSAENNQAQQMRINGGNYSVDPNKGYRLVAGGDKNVAAK